MMRRAGLLLFLALVALPSIAHAGDAGHGLSCADRPEGSNACNVNGCFVCTSGSWVDQPLYLGASSATCDATTAALVRYNSGSLQFCNGTDWLTFASGTGSDYWSLSGTDLFYTGGNVGIGTASPSMKLDIYTDADSFQHVRFTNSNAGASAAATLNVSNGTGSILIGKLGTGATGWLGYGTAGDSYIYSTSSGGSNLNIINSYASGSIAMFAGGSAATTPDLFISSGGNVGIGTPTPTNKLHVQGTAAGSAGIYMNDAAPSSTTNTLYNDGGALYWNGAPITSAGDVLLGTSTAATNPHVSGDATTGLFSATATSVSVAIEGSEIVQVIPSAANFNMNYFNIIPQTVSPTSGMYIYQVGDGTGDGVIWRYGLQRPGGGNSAAFGQASTNYLTGGVMPWIGNNNLFIAFPNDEQFRIGAGNGSTPTMAFTGDGKVGIGTTAPAYTLDVAGTARVTSTANPGFVVGNGSTGYVQVGSAGWYDDGTYFSPLGTRHFYIRNTVPTTYIYSSNIYLGSTSGATVHLRGNAIDADNYGITAAGAASFNSNVGIGTLTAPATTLDVYGAVKTSRLGTYGTYNSAQVQGIWSISEGYPISVASNNFGTQYGIGYAYSTNGGAHYTNEHQIVYTANGSVKAAISLSTGKAYFAGHVTVPTPTADTDAATKAYVDAASGPSWAGYTAAYNGARGGTLGMSNTCHASYSGSHACTWDEIIRLGASYPATYDAWVVDGMEVGVDGYMNTRDGRVRASDTYKNCSGWTNSASSRWGSVIQTTGGMYTMTCNNTNRIPCCY